MRKLSSAVTFHAISFTQMLFIAGAAALLMLSLFQPATAAESSPFQSAFEASYARPADIDAALHYAEEAVKIGDYESAISPLERILMFNPRLSDVRLEVGVLYYMLESYDVARQHFMEVLRDDNADADTASRAKRYLAKL